MLLNNVEYCQKWRGPVWGGLIVNIEYKMQSPIYVFYHATVPYFLRSLLSNIDTIYYLMNITLFSILD